MRNIHKIDPSLIKLENFLTKSSIKNNNFFIFYLLFLVFCSCTPEIQKRPIEPQEVKDSSIGILSVKKAPLAPWEVWNKTTYLNSFLRDGYRFSEEGKIFDATKSFLSAVSSARSAEEAELSLLEACGSLLKQGNAEEALGRISKYASLNNKKPSELDSRFSLLTAYAYVLKDDTNQALAWFSQAHRSSRGSGVIAEESRRSAMHFVRTFNNSQLNDALRKWTKDIFVSSILQGEESRRLQGGNLLLSSSIKKWFLTETYFVEPSSRYADLNDLTNNNQSFDGDGGVDFKRDNSLSSEESKLVEQSSDVDSVNNTGLDFNFAAYLPLSGVYNEHARRIEEGILLSLETFSPTSRLITIDSESSEIDKISMVYRENNIKALFGPLLVKDVERLSPQCERLSIPCISFAKRKGIPDLGNSIFRLGANADNQLIVLIRYAERVLGARSFLLVYPDNPSGYEFKEALDDIKSASYGESLSSLSYSPKSLESFHTLVQEAKNLLPDVIIIADSISSSEPLLRLLKDNTVSGGLSNIPVMGVSLFSNPQEIRRYSSLVEGVFIVSLFNPFSKREDIVSFFNNYRNRFMREPDLLSALSFDATTFLLNAFGSENFRNNINGNEIRALKEAPSYNGITGRINVLQNGELYRDLQVLTVINGLLVEN